LDGISIENSIKHGGSYHEYPPFKRGFSCKIIEWEICQILVLTAGVDRSYFSKVFLVEETAAVLGKLGFLQECQKPRNDYSFQFSAGMPKTQK
jgi:hypothetical protein